MAKPKANGPEVVDPFGAPAKYQWGSKPIGYANKDEYIAKEIVFTIADIIAEPGQGFQGGDRWVVVALNEDGEYEAITFGTNAKRDESMRAAKAFIAAKGPIENKVLNQVGQAVYINAAPEPKDDEAPF